MKPKILPPSPRLTAGLFSRLTFVWIYPLFWKGSKKELELDDLYDILPEDKSEILGKQLNLAWKEEVIKCREYNEKYESHSELTFKQRKPKLFNVLCKLYFWKWATLGIFTFFIEECVMKMVQPLFLGLLLRQLKGEFPKEYGYLFATGVALTTAYCTISHHPAFFKILQLNMQIRISCSSLVYQKALQLNQASVSDITIGRLVNILSNDVSRFDQGLDFLHYLWIGPVQLGISVYILWGYFGPSCLAGVLFLLLFTPFQSIMGRLFGKLRLESVTRTDSRIRLMNDIINGVRLIKLYTWEIPFAKLVNSIRESEIKIIRKMTILRSINQSLYYVSSKVILFLTLLTYVLTGNFLTAEKVFVASAFYNNVRLIMTIFFPLGIAQLAETIVAFRRIDEFLNKEAHINSDVNKRETEEAVAGEEANLGLYNVSAKWNSSLNEETLKNITMEVKSSQLLAIIGPVGSGKSSILQVILQELPITSGSMKVSGRIAYACQEPWIFSGSIRENIVFGHSYDMRWYDQVIEACCLQKDFEILKYADKTMVGDKGITLSGGQKSRISLARAVYSKRDIYLLDDPLSAVDSHVSRILFHKCIRGILKNKLVILVTHQIQFLQDVDHIVAINSNGSVEAQGKYEDVVEKNQKVVEILKSSTSMEDESTKRKTSFVKEMHLELKRKMSVISDEIEEDTEEESKFVGSVSAKTYWQYIRSGSSCVSITALLLVNIGTQVMFTGADYWLQLWTKEEENMYQIDQQSNNISNITIEDVGDQFSTEYSRKLRVFIYTGIIATLFVTSLTKAVAFFRMTMRSSINLHIKLFQGVLYVPMRFYETNPIGRILNRFAKDISIIDDLLPLTLFDTLEVGLHVIGVLVVISILNPIFLIPSAVLAVMFFVIRNLYLKTARSIKRLEGVARSPVFSHLSATLQGLKTIRAFRAEKQFIGEFHHHLDIHSTTWFLFISTTRWLGIVVDWVSILFITIVTYGLMIFQKEGDGAVVGLAVSSAMTLTSWFQWGVRQSAEAENQMVSVERVMEYSNLESEAALQNPEYKPCTQWPSSGTITVKDLCVTYNENEDCDYVLKNVSFIAKAGEKIGIVGRTGAGKSSLLSAIFRITEPSAGSIVIDGYNCLKLGLHDLRSKISILPQEPVLFIGTLRYNLDPFENYNDTQVWDSLKDVHLWETIHDMSGGLDTIIAEGGGNFSVGQRQLICLARAILLNNKILILDEATANVDPKTDKLIQKTIREKFGHCTVLTVAHRLDTVMDSDRIMVMDLGTIKEFDEPLTLLENSDSLLLKMVQQTGQTSTESLINIAKEASRKRRLQTVL